MGLLYTLAITSFLVFCAGAQGAKWGEWKDITRCSAKPCKCPGVEEEDCEFGVVIQMRVCITDGFSVCKPDNDGGSMRRKDTCKNVGVCPGWSIWKDESCDCDTGIGKRVRHCDNPPPIHKDVLCQMNNTDKGEKETDFFENCTCSAPTEPVTEEITTAMIDYTTTQLPCCSDDYEVPTALPNISIEISSPKTTTAKKSNDYYGMYDYDFTLPPTCRPCNDTVTESDDDMSDVTTVAIAADDDDDD